MAINDEFLKGLDDLGYTDKITFDPSVFKEDKIEKIRCIIRFFLIQRKGGEINEEFSSYSLKHNVDRFLKTYNMPFGNYVSNGEFIYAMILEGFKVRRDGRNAYFNITTQSGRKFNHENSYRMRMRYDNGLVCNNG